MSRSYRPNQFCCATRSPSKHRIRPGSALVSVLVVILLAATWDRQVSGQTPSAQALGPYVADFLLGTGGALDGNGAGARSLATGSTITTGSTYFAGWRGNLTVTAPVVLGGYSEWHRTHVQTSPPPQVPGQYSEWYNDDSYFFQVYDSGTSPGGGIYCGVYIPDGGRKFFLYVRSSARFTECGVTFGETPFPSASMSMETVLSAWSKFRGKGGLNPSAPPDQDNANIWAREWIDAGKWASEVKPALDAAIRRAVTSADLEALGITGNPPIDQPPQVRRIAIDAGHAPTPDGCRGAVGVTQWPDVEGGFLREEVLVQEIAQQIALDFVARGHTVRLTRPPDCTVVWDKREKRYVESATSLRARVNEGLRSSTNDPPSEIFLSIHLNSSSISTVHGTEAWYEARSELGTPDTIGQSLALAGRVVDEQVRPELGLVPFGAGVKENYHYDAERRKWVITAYILEYAQNQFPLGTVLDEVAFLSNNTGTCPDETRLHNSPECSSAFRRRVANAIENAIRLSWP